MSLSAARTLTRIWQSPRYISRLRTFKSLARCNHVSASPAYRQKDSTARQIAAKPSTDVGLVLHGSPYQVSPILLRDMCTCERCVDPSTRQKLFLTTDIPPDIHAKEVNVKGENVQIEWNNDVETSATSHSTTISIHDLARLVGMTETQAVSKLPERVTWTDERYRKDTIDIPFDAYMQDDSVLLRVLKQLQTHGLAFLTDVPGTAESVSEIAGRIGPLKNTFYGSTWDVRSVPQAKNVAYTSQDLGFHMDLLYMHQPPHLQFLHCIRSSAAGGASLFTDSYRTVEDLVPEHHIQLMDLMEYEASYHYNHMETHYYHQSRPVISMKPLKYNNVVTRNLKILNTSAADHQKRKDARAHFLSNIVSYIDSVAWSPPFQAPFQLSDSRNHGPRDNGKFQSLNGHVRKWLKAAKVFNQFIHRPEMIYERMMRPGECVLFDNRRVLHARKAFEVADAGKERWLRGAYLDKDPFESKLRVLQKRFV